MTVSELIEELLEVPGDLRVYFAVRPVHPDECKPVEDVLWDMDDGKIVAVTLL